ncbi:hypothetical protein DICPUDRAFT_33678 [Dictyostelium purpureum]|uniref:Terpene synthase 2 n=1 Tax=Dictyostelium purpureum TaxID=5786 RepID=TPS2_DICPU|nr:uncharacterized protein DICPUDRAFT_33678 [Dictyostelium purpureum]F0ZL92.1 RecName: Full=Terpene synthase 2 [Dictyostelium purpureum]AXN72971.1 terpene synthase [Dictyostelium purpureum]EGC35260.1 hypothetical protein DICPUDRAFT_33678 [Dictyostelium purpureum]|eukprot:XP_003288186.1 hypothetical protein DICPUDRAFT_33678 [Dictyostelium purpureum]
MNLTLKDFHVPNEWNVKSINDNSFIQECYQKAIEMNIYDKSDEKGKAVMYHALTVCPAFWPTVTYDQLVLSGYLMLWLILFDDDLDTVFIPDDEATEIINRTELIFLEGILPTNPTKKEEFTLFFRNQVLKMSGNRLDMFNLFLNYTIQWIHSIIPLNKTIEPHMDLFLFIRKLNVGVYPLIGLSCIFFSNDKIDQSLFLNPRWLKLCEATSIVTALYNDCVSYAKEVKGNAGVNNCLWFLQKKNNTSIQDTFKYICEKSNMYIKEFQNHEEKLLNQYNNIQPLATLLNSLKYIMNGKYYWSMNTARYASPSSPFIEIQNAVSPDNKLINNEL